MEIETCNSPLVIDKVDDWLLVENGYLIRLGNEHHHVCVNLLNLLQELRVLVLDLCVHSMGHGWQQVHCILDLVQIGGVQLLVFWNTGKGVLRES